MSITELSTKQVRARLEKTLDAIWRMGDRDECSIKHINHSIAAIIRGETWRDGDDYPLPRDDETATYPNWCARLEENWNKVQALHDHIGPEKFREAALATKHADFFLASYLELHSHGTFS